MAASDCFRCDVLTVFLLPISSSKLLRVKRNFWEAITVGFIGALLHLFRFHKMNNPANILTSYGLMWIIKSVHKYKFLQPLFK